MSNTRGMIGDSSKHFSVIKATHLIINLSISWFSIVLDFMEYHIFYYYFQHNKCKIYNNINTTYNLNTSYFYNIPIRHMKIIRMKSMILHRYSLLIQMVLLGRLLIGKTKWHGSWHLHQVLNIGIHHKMKFCKWRIAMA